MPSGRIEPNGPAANEAADILLADERDVFAEASPIRFDKTAAVLILLADHAVEDFGRGRVVGFEILGEIGVDASVLLFLRNGESEDFLFGKGVEGTHEEGGRWSAEGGR